MDCLNENSIIRNGNVPITTNEPIILVDNIEGNTDA